MIGVYRKPLQNVFRILDIYRYAVLNHDSTIPANWPLFVATLSLPFLSGSIAVEYYSRMVAAESRSTTTELQNETDEPRNELALRFPVEFRIRNRSSIERPGEITHGTRGFGRQAKIGGVREVHTEYRENSANPIRQNPAIRPHVSGRSPLRGESTCGTP